jgi:hypothetical protein
VDFLGKQDRIHEKLPVADVMLLPSELESFGLAALEAMACEVVPIATNRGGVPEVIQHGETGFLAEVGDVDTMANYAIEILSDDAKLTLLHEYARTLVSEQHVWEWVYDMPVKGKVVMDVGAGCGETAWFYFHKGAKKVIAIEPREDCGRYLELNKRQNGWDMDIIHGPFKMEHFDIPHDCLKADTEGYFEMAALKSDLKTLGTCRMEVHPWVIGWDNQWELVKRFKLHQMTTMAKMGTPKPVLSENIWGADA